MKNQNQTDTKKMKTVENNKTEHKFYNTVMIPALAVFLPA